MLRVGLTGGLASGKSTVAARLAELGIPVLDADRVVHALYEPGAPGARAVAAAFGPGVLDSRGAVDRPRLAAVAFSEAASVARLNAVVHPLVREETARWLAAQEAAGSPVAVVEGTLLLENQGRSRFDVLVAVSAPAEVRLARALARDPSASPATLRARLSAQMPEDLRNAACDEVLANDGDREELLARADALAARLRARAAGERPGG